jgi:hypothetical protein
MPNKVLAGIAEKKEGRSSSSMSALGQKPKSESIHVMSAVPPKADALPQRKDFATGVARPKQTIT